MRIRVLIFSGAVTSFLFGNTSAETAKTIPWNQLGAEVAKQSGGKGLAVSELWNGYRLECRMQDLQAEVTMSGVKIISTSKSEGGGSFTIRPCGLGRAELMKKLPGVADWMNMKDGVVKVSRGKVVEEYTSSGDGIRQDFVVSERPRGTGKLVLGVAIKGATAKKMNEEIRLKLESGRNLVYHDLSVTDAAGKTLAASFANVNNSNITIVVDDRNASYPVHIDPTITDADWVSMGHVPGVNGTVKALIADISGNLYVGGSFSVAGGAIANNIAKWDGNTWSALGSGTNGTVNALVFDDSGSLYVGGSFTTAGAATVNNIAKWDGSTWSAVGSGLNGTINALTVDTFQNLYAGGFYPVSIVRWNGNAWSAVGGGLDINSVVRALAIDSYGNLYAGGTFSMAGARTAFNIAKWNGVWSALFLGPDTLGISGTDGGVYALVVDDSNNLYAGGAFTHVTGKGSSHISKWNGSTWSALSSGTNSTVNALAVDYSGNLYAGGEFTDAGGAATSKMAKWGNNTWSILGSGTNGNVNKLVLDRAGRLFAGGDFTCIGGTAANRVAEWDGSGWSALGSGFTSTVYDLAVDRSGNLYACGSFGYYVVKWDGSTWATVGAMNCPIYKLTVDNYDNLYAAGYFDIAGGIAAYHIAKWDGIGWSAMDIGLRVWIYALTSDSLGNIYAGGLPGINVAGVSKWNGTTWDTLGVAKFGAVTTIGVDNSGNLYAGGNFDTIGGVYVPGGIAKWDGSSWSSLGSVGSGINYQPKALAVDDLGILYAGGYMTTAGGVAANHIAQWNGSSWSPLGSGTNDIINTLVVDGTSSNLYAGGAFTIAGGKVSAYIAQCMLTGTAVKPARGGDISRHFLTYDTRTGLMHFQLKSPTEISYRIYSLSGRSVFYASEKMGAGDHSMRINATCLPRGTYIVHCKAGDEAIRFRMVVDR
jgi:hypothetical protein